MRGIRRHSLRRGAAAWRRSLLILPLLALVAARVPAQDAVSVPGGTAPFRRLFGLDSQRPDAAFFLDLHEVLLFDSREDVSWSKVETRQRAVHFVEDLEQWKELFGNPARFATAPPNEWVRCARALDWLGFTIEGSGASFVVRRRSDPVSARRQSFLDILGIPTAAFFSRLLVGETVTIDIPGEAAPLPFGLADWRETVSEPELASENAFLFFLKNIRASRMLVALHDLDPETREELRVLLGDPKGRPLGWKLLYEEGLEPFSRYPEALVLRGGRFVLPGDPEAEPIWAEIFGVRPSERRAFLKALYRKDGGKGAYVVDVLQHLPDEKARALLLGQGAGGFRRIYASIDTAGENFDRTHRDPYDFAHLAPFVSLSPEADLLPVIAVSGRKDFPRNEAKLAGIVARERGAAGPPEESLRRVFQHDATINVGGFPAQRRFLFLSRLLADNPTLADPGLVLLLDRGLDRFLPAYSILEDIPFSRPELPRRYFFTLDRLDRRGTSRAGEVAAGLFQGDVFLLAQLFRSGALEPAQAERLFAELLDIPLFAREDSSPARDEAKLFAWLSRGLLPVLRENERRRDERIAAEESVDPDDLIERALVGRSPTGRIEWRGGHYRVDPAAEEVSRRRAFRETQRLARVADLEALHEKREEVLAAAGKGDLVGTQSAAAELAEGLGVSVLMEGLMGGAGDERIDRAASRAGESAADIAAIREATRLSTVPARLEALDAVMAERHLEALMGHVYAASAGNPDNLYYQDPSFVRRHSFRTVDSAAGPVRTAFSATELVEQQEGGGSQISGSLFGLPEVLGLLHADQLAYRGGARIPSETIRSGLVAPIWRMSVSRLDDDSLEVVAASCQATVELAGELAPLSPPDRYVRWDAIARDLVPRSRLTLLAALDGAPSEEHLSRFLSPSDLYRIGRRLLRPGRSTDAAERPAVVQAREAMARLELKYGPAGARQRLAEFGPRATAYAGWPRLADVEMPPYERLAAYRRPELLSERLYDLKIAVACRLADARLPAAVLPIVLPAALDAMLVELTMAYPYDWSATTRAAFAFSRSDLDRILDDAVRAGQFVRDDDPSSEKGNGS